MPIADTPSLFDKFLDLARRYIAEPDIVAGLELDEIAGQLKQRAAGELADSELTALLHRFRRAIPHQETETLAALLGAIDERAAAHGLSTGRTD
jgi:hypothetical protein